MQSLFLISNAGCVNPLVYSPIFALRRFLLRLNRFFPRFYRVFREVLIEKHWRGVTSRAVCDFFWEEVNKYDRKEVCHRFNPLLP